MKITKKGNKKVLDLRLADANELKDVAQILCDISADLAFYGETMVIRAAKPTELLFRTR